MGKIIRPCEEKDIHPLFEIFKTVYQFNPRLREQDYFDWQYKNTPFSDGKDYTFWIL